MYKPPSFVDFASRLKTDPNGASWDLDRALQNLSLASRKNANYNESPRGAVNGTNRTFTLANIPTPANALALVKRSSGTNLPLIYAVDYTLIGKIVTIEVAPSVGDQLFATYTY